MKKFRLLFSIPLFLLLLGGCTSSENSASKTTENCPTCNMKIPSSKQYTSTLYVKQNRHNFDDIGCMILFSKENQINLKDMKSEVFTVDTQTFINSQKAYYKTDAQTPMNYGFSAYENEQNASISFDKVIVKMLRGEHMANPKIRKLILGTKNEQ